MFNAGRHTIARTNQPAEPVLFLIGMRINKPWRVHAWTRVVKAMVDMQIELQKRPDLGLLAMEQWFGRTTIMVSYWESMEKLQAYAHDPALAHRSPWQAFMRRDDDTVGIWHETYRVGEHEALYSDMPSFGLGAALGTTPVGQGSQTHRQRLRRPTTSTALPRV